MPDAACTWDPSTFSAWAIYTGETPRMIGVAGSGRCRTTGWTHELEEDNPGIVPDPSELVLRIRSTEPAVGGDAFEDVTVESFFESSARRVVIRGLDLDLAVREPTDP